MTLASGLGVYGQGSGAPPRVPPPGSKAPVSGFTVVNTYPHDPTAFTQGLEYRDGFLYEGLGQQGKSGIRRVALETGKVLQEFKIPPGYFGEGITVTAGKLFELSWKDKTGFVYDAKTFRLIRNFSYFGEGWGLTHDETSLIMSDGTSALRFLETTRFSERRRVKVMDAGTAIPNLNELEMIKGEIWANVWQTDYIARISPKDGHVTGWVNLKGLLPPAPGPKPDVLNGIAYDSAKDRIFVRDGDVWTSAGISAGIDLSLAMIAEDYGDEIAQKTARQLVLYHRRSGGQSQFSSLLELKAPNGRFGPLLAWAREHLDAPLTVEDLAEQAGMSSRHFTRAFMAETGTTPSKAVERLRIEVARQCVQSSSEAIERVAETTGFRDPERMRRAFIRAFGQPPQSLRRAARSA